MYTEIFHYFLLYFFYLMILCCATIHQLWNNIVGYGRAWNVLINFFFKTTTKITKQPQNFKRIKDALWERSGALRVVRKGTSVPRAERSMVLKISSETQRKKRIEFFRKTRLKKQNWLTIISSQQTKNLCWILSNIFLVITCCFYGTISNYICSDYTIYNILTNSTADVPMFYKISATWSNHEGSLLLWCWFLSFSSLIFCIHSES